MSDTALSYSRIPDANPVDRVGTFLLIACAAVIFGLIPASYGLGWMGITTINQLGRFLALAIVGLGIDLVWGYAGILTLCQAMFFCFGGYAIGMHMALHGPLDGDHIPRCLYVVSSEVSGLQLPWFWKPFQTLPVALFLGLLLPGLFAGLFAFFTFRSRVKGVYFSIITQATTVAVALVFRKNELKLCGTNGLTNFVTLAGFDLQKPAVQFGLYLLTALALLVTYLLCRALVHSRLGRLLCAVRDNESRLRFAGYQPVSFKVFIFVLGAMLAALGGMLYTPQNGIITPYKMDPDESIALVAFVAVGGRGSLSGALVGSVVVSYLKSFLSSGVFYAWVPVFLRVPDDASAAQSTFRFMDIIRIPLKTLLTAEGWYFVLGGMFIIVTLFFPSGIVGAWRSLLQYRPAKRAGQPANAPRPTPAPHTLPASVNPLTGEARHAS